MTDEEIQSMETVNEEIPKTQAEEQLNKDLEGLFNDEEDKTKGERYYSKEFRKIYTVIRKGLVTIKKANITNKARYEKALTLMEEFVE